MLIKYSDKRETITKGSTTIVIALGCGYDPDYTIKNNLKPLSGTPYMLYDNVWYHIKIDKYYTYERFIEYMKKDNFSEEIFLEKIISLI